MPKYVLHYFDAKGRAEVVRLVFAAADICYTDRRFKAQDWPSIQPTTPLGQVPYLEVDNQIIPQSQAILRYVSREAGFNGKNNLDEAKINAILDTLHDARNAYIQKVMLAKPEEKEEAAKRFNQEDMPKHFGNILKLISLWSTQSDHAVGDSLTVADIALYDFFTFNQEVQNVAENTPLLKDIVNGVGKNPRIAAYVQARHQTDF